MDAVRVIAEPRRREILRLVWDAERPATEIAQHFDITFGAVSQHLSVLRKAGLVVVRRDGTRRFYRADRDALRPYTPLLRQMWADRLDQLADLAEAAEAEAGTGAGFAAAEPQAAVTEPRARAAAAEQETP